MRFDDLPIQWKRIFELEWESLCMGSKAIAAVITDESGKIISEGRNMIGERTIPNPAAAHAETEAVRGLDTSRFPNKHSYTLFAGLEPCVMCMGTIVMGGIRNVEFAAKDDFGGAMQLITQTAFMRSKNIRATLHGGILGDLQRGLQTMRELLYNNVPVKLERMLTDFSVHNKAGVEAAEKLMKRGFLDGIPPGGRCAEEAVSELLRIIK